MRKKLFKTILSDFIQEFNFELGTSQNFQDGVIPVTTRNFEILCVKIVIDRESNY